MTTDNGQKVVQDAVLEGTTLPEGEKPLEPSPEEKMATLIQQEVAKALATQTETAKREIQSVKDKAKDEVGRARTEAESAQRRAKLVEGTVGAVRKSFQESEPEVAKELELQELRARDAGRLTLEQEEQAKQAHTEWIDQFYASLTQHLSSLGIDEKDQRLDWGTDAKDAFDAQRRFLDSVAKIQKETQQTMEDGFEKRLKDIETRVSQVNVEANSVNTTTSQGVVAGSDAEFVKQFGSGELPMTKANVDRYDKIVKSY